MTMTAKVQTIDEEKELATQALTLKQKALAIIQGDARKWAVETYQKTVEFIKPLKALEKQIIEHYKPIKQGIDESKKVVLDKEKADLAPVREAIQLMSDAANIYITEQKRLEAERQEKARKEQEAIAAREREKLLKQAAKADDKGKTEQAERLLEQAEDVYVKPVTVEKAAVTTKTENVTAFTATETVVTVTNLKRFIEALVDQKINPTMLDVKAGPLKAWVNAMGITQFPGIEIEKKAKLRVR